MQKFKALLSFGFAIVLTVALYSCSKDGEQFRPWSSSPTVSASASISAPNSNFNPIGLVDEDTDPNAREAAIDPLNKVYLVFGKASGCSAASDAKAKFYTKDSSAADLKEWGLTYNVTSSGVTVTKFKKGLKSFSVKMDGKQYAKTFDNTANTHVWLVTGTLPTVTATYIGKVGSTAKLYLDNAGANSSSAQTISSYSSFLNKNYVTLFAAKVCSQ